MIKNVFRTVVGTLWTKDIGQGSSVVELLTQVARVPGSISDQSIYFHSTNEYMYSYAHSSFPKTSVLFERPLHQVCVCIHVNLPHCVSGPVRSDLDNTTRPQQETVSIYSSSGLLHASSPSTIIEIHILQCINISQLLYHIEDFSQVLNLAFSLLEDTMSIILANYDFMDIDIQYVACMF